MMKPNEILISLKKLGKTSVDHQMILSSISRIKAKYILNKQEAGANQFWIYQQIVEIHIGYIEMFSNLKKKDFIKAWGQLEQLEIKLTTLAKHFSLKDNIYELEFIQKTILNFQAIFPYRLFTSIEFIEKEILCTICRSKVHPRNGCGHIVGELYMGEICYREVVDFEILGLAIVENPVIKSTVLMPTNGDNHDYTPINYLIGMITNPYEDWDVEIQYKLIPHSNFSNISEEKSCPCLSRKSYGECCLLIDGVKMIHYEFIVRNPNPKSYLTNTKNKQVK